MSGVDQSILREAAALVYGERASTHGSFRANFDTAAASFNAQAQRDLHPYEVALLLVHLKLARMSQNQGHRDNYVDAAGYLDLAYRMANEVPAT